MVDPGPKRRVREPNVEDLKLLDWLTGYGGGPASVEQAASFLGESQQSASSRLAVLAEAGLVWRMDDRGWSWSITAGGSAALLDLKVDPCEGADRPKEPPMGITGELAAALHNLLETCSHPPAVADECLACPDWWSFDREGDHHDSCTYGYAKVEAYRVLGRAMTSLGLRVEQLVRKPPKPDLEGVPIRIGDVVAARVPGTDTWRKAEVLQVFPGGRRIRCLLEEAEVPFELVLPVDHVRRKPRGGGDWYWTAFSHASLRDLNGWEGPLETRAAAVIEAFKGSDAANPVVGRWDPVHRMMVQAEEVTAAEPSEGAPGPGRWA